jgi:hypothetical protein
MFISKAKLERLYGRIDRLEETALRLENDTHLWRPSRGWQEQGHRVYLGHTKNSEGDFVSARVALEALLAKLGFDIHPKVTTHVPATIVPLVNEKGDGYEAKKG